MDIIYKILWKVFKEAGVLEFTQDQKTIKKLMKRFKIEPISILNNLMTTSYPY